MCTRFKVTLTNRCDVLFIYQNDIWALRFVALICIQCFSTVYHRVGHENWKS